MDRVAFYAPMKPPTHSVPSGDREMARHLMSVIGARASVDLVSDLRVHDRKGNATHQADMYAQAKAETERLSEALASNDTRLWVTYHNYYKAPDLIGPTVCRALGLPYVQIESTRARSRLAGSWAGFAAAAEQASDAADVIFYMTELDLITLARDRTETQRLIHLRPFLPSDHLPESGDCRTGPMLSVGMMRPGDKLASYQIIAETLAVMPGDWILEIAGDGPARDRVEELMAPFGERVHFLGQLDQTGLTQAYCRASLFFWPGVNEAYGMVYLEAQAAGLPVVAQDRPGVRDVLLSGDHPAPKEGPQALAQKLTRLRNDPDLRHRQGDAARKQVQRNHLSLTATETFWASVDPLLEDQT